MRAGLRALCLMMTLAGASTGCSHVFYQPAREQMLDPKKLELSYEEVRFKAADETTLSGWFFPAALEEGESPKGTFVQFHGNAENISTHFLSLAWVVNFGYNFFTFDYRGYGNSEGSPSQEGLNADALAALRYVSERVPARSSPDLVLYGQSLGGAVLLRAIPDLGVRTRVRLVVIDSSFHSYQSIARNKLASNWLTFIFQPLAYALVSDAYSPEDSIPAVSPTPLLVIHGDRDHIVPVEFGEKIFEGAKEPKWFWRIKNGRHIDSMIRHDGKYRQRLIEWLNAGMKLESWDKFD